MLLFFLKASTTNERYIKEKQLSIKCELNLNDMYVFISRKTLTIKNQLMKHNKILKIIK